MCLRACGKTWNSLSVRNSLEFAEIRRRLQDAGVELVKLLQECAKQNLSLSGVGDAA